MKEGLSHEMVNCLYNDSRGFLWIGTDFGLNRFDGVRFEKWFHQPGDTNSLLSNKINSISEDKQHRLWLGTDVGVSVYDMHRGLFHSYSEINTGTGVIRNLLHVK
ncbi:MAG TPA: two-component regulator propeller domain-containing protein, partial [Ferruginibacter sp.]|nr:two-component regulator propeller domain-containing protein [Ferruginibacter sp.]